MYQRGAKRECLYDYVGCSISLGDLGLKRAFALSELGMAMMASEHSVATVVLYHYEF